MVLIWNSSWNDIKIFINYKRNNCVFMTGIEILNHNYQPNYEEPRGGAKTSSSTTTKVQVDTQNAEKKAADSYRRHLSRIKDSGIKWVRLEAADIEVVKYACTIGLNVIAIVKSQTAIYDSLGIKEIRYFPWNWGKIWGSYVEKKVEELSSIGVKVWQVDNELNHPGQNLLPSQNPRLAQDIVRIGANAIRNIDPTATITVNLNYSPPLIKARDFIMAYRFLRDIEGVPLHILGMDYYKGGWSAFCPGSPSEYAMDVENHHKLWSGDILIMETGFCTYPDNGSLHESQCDFMKSVFSSLDALIKKASWFKGVMWYEYSSKHWGFPCEDYFGLHYIDGLEEHKKLAWNEFLNLLRNYDASGKIFGVQYHLYP